jgi:hypothetical protein
MPQLSKKSSGEDDHNQMTDHKYQCMIIRPWKKTHARIQEDVSQMTKIATVV